MTSIRLSQTDLKALRKIAERKGCKTVSAFIRMVANSKKLDLTM